ncbi:beige/BEACH domain protein, putative, partial [Hepatocystis sp. ex Piliocolobus tephrosceles]
EGEGEGEGNNRPQLTHSNEDEDEDEDEYKYIQPVTYNTNVYNELITKKIHNDSVKCISQCNHLLATGSTDETINLIDVKNDLEIIQTYDNFNDGIKHLDLKNKLLFCRSNNLKLFDIRIGNKNIPLNNLNSINNNGNMANDNINMYANLNNIDTTKKNPFSNKLFTNKLFTYNMYPIYNRTNKKLLMFYNTIHKFYDKHYYYIPKNYTYTKCIFNKKINKNPNKNFKHILNNKIIYSSLLNNNIILCIDKCNNYYVYDIRSEKWYNIISSDDSENTEDKYISTDIYTNTNKLISAYATKDCICTVNNQGNIFFKNTKYRAKYNYNNYKNIKNTLDVFNDTCSITPSFITFLNINENSQNVINTLDDYLDYSECNYVLFSSQDGLVELHNKLL